MKIIVPVVLSLIATLIAVAVTRLLIRPDPLFRLGRELPEPI
jgi:hypothetical protein